MSKVIDPVCGMQIEPEEAAGKLEYQGQTYYFCGEGCEKAFQAEPSKYAMPKHQDHDHHH